MRHAVKELNLSPNAITFNILIKACAMAKNLDRAENFFEVSNAPDLWQLLLGVIARFCSLSDLSV